MTLKYSETKADINYRLENQAYVRQSLGNIYASFDEFTKNLELKERCACTFEGVRYAKNLREEIMKSYKASRTHDSHGSLLTKLFRF